MMTMFISLSSFIDIITIYTGDSWVVSRGPDCKGSWGTLTADIVVYDGYCR
jgi:hypothetical protein